MQRFLWNVLSKFHKGILLNSATEQQSSTRDRDTCIWIAIFKGYKILRIWVQTEKPGGNILKTLSTKLNLCKKC